MQHGGLQTRKSTRASGYLPSIVGFRILLAFYKAVELRPN
jgi:hypothetical protein